MCSGGRAVCWLVICRALAHPVVSGVEIGRETPVQIGLSRPFSLPGDLGDGGGWSHDGWSCALGDGLECGTLFSTSCGHTMALETVDGGELSIF